MFFWKLPPRGHFFSRPNNILIIQLLSKRTFHVHPVERDQCVLYLAVFASLRKKGKVEYVSRERFFFYSVVFATSKRASDFRARVQETRQEYTSISVRSVGTCKTTSMNQKFGWRFLFAKVILLFVFLRTNYMLALFQRSSIFRIITVVN